MTILGIDVLSFLVIAPALSALLVMVIPGGKQIVIDDPSGNPIELFQPAAQRRT